MQLSPDHGDIDQAIADFVSAAFSPEEREIARLKARIEQLRPRSHARVIVMREIMELRLKQLGKVLP